MRLTFLWVGKTRDASLSALEQRYLKRLSRFLPTERTVVPESKKKDRRQQAVQLEREAQAIEQRLSGNGHLVVFEEDGHQFSSRELADLLQNWMNSGLSEAAFLVGGPSGLPERIVRRADYKWSLSRLTLPHEMARVVVLEQIYRALTILRGMPYHK